MSGAVPGLWNLVLLPLGLGLLGFVEPCTVGTSLLFVKYLEGRRRAAKIRATLLFTLVRGGFIGALGALAGEVGAAFLGFQRGFWIFLGALYVGLGAVYLLRRQRVLLRGLGASLPRAGEVLGATGLGVLFGLNVPACAAPLLGAAWTATLGAGGALRGFVSLGIFGVALSLPILAAVLWSGGREWLDRLAGLAGKMPLWTGALFVGLGLWSVYFGLAG